MPNSLEDLRKFRFSWRRSMKEAESFAHAVESHFPGKLREFYEITTARQQRSHKRVFFAGSIAFLASAALTVWGMYSHPEHPTDLSFLVPGVISFLLFMLVIVIINKLVPDKIYQREFIDFQKNIPADIMVNVRKLQRDFQIDFRYRPFVVRRRPRGAGGNGGGEGSGGGGNGGGGNGGGG